MISIGNDVVDLNFVDRARSLQPRFYSKFLSVSECKILSDAALSTLGRIKYTWLLWSAKEAIYKFEKRLQPELIFSPAKIIFGSEFTEFENLQDMGDNQSKFLSFLNLENSDSDTFLNFIFQNKTYYIRSTATSNYITTIANNVPDFAGIETGIDPIEQSDYDYQAAEVRRFFLARLETIYPDCSFAITKNEVGYPIIKSIETAINLIASFAHHGNYVAYAFTEQQELALF